MFFCRTKSNLIRLLFSSSNSIFFVAFSVCLAKSVLPQRKTLKKNCQSNSLFIKQKNCKELWNSFQQRGWAVFGREKSHKCLFSGLGFHSKFVFGFSLIFFPTFHFFSTKSNLPIGIFLQKNIFFLVFDCQKNYFCLEISLCDEFAYEVLYWFPYWIHSPCDTVFCALILCSISLNKHFLWFIFR